MWSTLISSLKTEHISISHDEALYKESMKILGDRNNTEYEDIVAIDARSGEVLEKNTLAAQHGYKHRCGFSPEQYKRLEERRRAYETLHNHPSSSIPSRDDIQKLFERPHQTASNINYHNGDLYRLEKLKPFDDIDELVNEAYNKMKEEYGSYGKERVEYETSITIINTLTRSGHLKFVGR